MTLNKENRQLFSEQVKDHISKLNDLMGGACGDGFDRNRVQKACFAGRLLEGSTRMLGFMDWSGALVIFRELLEKYAATGRSWDEQISQIVSEVLETEEHLAEEVATEEIEGMDTDRFEGIGNEISVLLSESFEGETAQPEAMRIEKPEGSGGEPLFEMPSDEDAAKTGPSDLLDESEDAEEQAREMIRDLEGERIVGRLDAAEENGPAEEPRGDVRRGDGFMTITRLHESISKISERLAECMDNAGGGGPSVRDLELAIGESEFFIGLLGGMLSRMGDDRKPFRTKVSSATVMEGLEDFVGVNGRLRCWKTELMARTPEFSLEREAASDLAVILENCIFDICSMSERGSGSGVSIKIDVCNEGSWIEVRLFDDADDYLCDSQIDRYDEVAFYHGLLKARALLRKWGALLWVEPAEGREGRFKFTFPRTSVITDYHLLDASGVTLAVPRHAVDSVVPAEEVLMSHDGGGRYIELSGMRIPVCRVDELAADEVEASPDGDTLVILGLAEKRMGIFSDGRGHRVEGIIDQLTEGEWASLTRRILHIGESEYPVLDCGLLLARLCWYQGMNEKVDVPGSWVDEAAGKEESEEETISRA